MLQQFGIVFGTNRVILYVKPIEEDVVSNTSRTMLMIDREPLPWARWAEEFREKIPQEIKALMEEICSTEHDRDNEKSIRERLKPLMHLYKVDRYRVTEDGNFEVDDGSALGDLAEAEGTGSTGRSKRGKVKTPRLGAGGVYHNFLKNKGKKANRSSSDPFPRVTWISVSTGTREPGQLEDRAASYNAATNDLLINADFRVFKSMTETWEKEFDGVPNAYSASRAAVQMWFEQVLVEAVIGIQSLKDSKEWDYKQLEAALSEEALTMAVMPRYFVNFAVKRELGTKLGKQK
jgi:hypothetical protein